MTVAAEPSESTTRRTLVVLLVAVAGLLLAGGIAVAFGIASPGDRGGPAPDDVVVVIPAGTGARVDAGEQVDIVPRRILVPVGGALVLENQDDRVHTIGPYAVGPGRQFRMLFTRPGTYAGVCSIDPRNHIEIVVA